MEIAPSEGSSMTGESMAQIAGMPGKTLVPYPGIHQHGVIGDRRTAALIAADGTVDWLCVPDYSSDIFFGSLLDAQRGGHWKVGPKRRVLGEQRYIADCALLCTHWDLRGVHAELLDFMAWPENDRSESKRELHLLVRRLRVEQDQLDCICDFAPRYNFTTSIYSQSASASFRTFLFADVPVSFWTNAPLSANRIEFRAQPETDYWFALEYGGVTHWSIETLAELAESTKEYWRNWADKLTYQGPKRAYVRRAAQTIHLLSYAPSGSIVAAPTTSLPERIGGDWNADYRYSWVRDASLCMSMLVSLGNKDDTRAYMKCLTNLPRVGGDAPLQVLYGINGETELKQRELEDVAGYRHSAPVRIGNHAYKQRQLDSLGYLCDCAWVYLEAGGEWDESFWKLIQHAAEFTAGNWERKDNSLWELSVRAEYVSSKVMSWVVLDRSLKIADRLNEDRDTSSWRRQKDRIFESVMERGWSEKLQAFRQRYDADSLDAAALLIPIMGFLPPEHPRVRSTIKRIAAQLTINDFVYRFDPEETPGLEQLPLGEFEGAFLPCTFWLATAFAMSGSPDSAERILKRASAICGETHLFAEAVDPRLSTFLGNFPLLFSQLEYVRALLEIDRARGDSKREDRTETEKAYE